MKKYLKRAFISIFWFGIIIALVVCIAQMLVLTYERPSIAMIVATIALISWAIAASAIFIWFWEQLFEKID